MKKFIQISLVVILLFVLFQATTGGSVVLADQNSSNVVRNISIMANTHVQGVQMVACLGIKGMICIKPYVGWNT